MQIKARTVRAAPERAIANTTMTTSAARITAMTQKGTANDPVDGSKLNISPSSLHAAPCQLYARTAAPERPMEHSTRPILFPVGAPAMLPTVCRTFTRPANVAAAPPGDVGTSMRDRRRKPNTALSPCSVEAF